MKFWVQSPVSHTQGLAEHWGSRGRWIRTLLPVGFLIEAVLIWWDFLNNSRGDSCRWWNWMYFQKLNSYLEFTLLVLTEAFLSWKQQCFLFSDISFLIPGMSSISNPHWKHLGMIYGLYSDIFVPHSMFFKRSFQLS